MQVEHEFYIPKLSQNWIVGPRLVKGTELNKPLKELGIKGEGVQEVSVFMYVMHTKKAQVPNEATRVRQQQHRLQQQQDLQNIQQQTQVWLCNLRVIVYWSVNYSCDMDIHVTIVHKMKGIPCPIVIPYPLILYERV